MPPLTQKVLEWKEESKKKNIHVYTMMRGRTKGSAGALYCVSQRSASVIYRPECTAFI